MDKSKKIKTWAYFMRLGNRMGCHQREDRSFHMKGWQFPICSRCTGILVGQLIGLFLYLCGVYVSYLLAFCFLFVMFVDWWIQYKGILESTNVRRLVTGILAGVAQMSILLNTILFVWTLFI